MGGWKKMGCWVVGTLEEGCWKKKQEEEEEEERCWVRCTLGLRKKEEARYPYCGSDQGTLVPGAALVV